MLIDVTQHGFLEERRDDDEDGWSVGGIALADQRNGQLLYSS
jgi:hypothetical protein